MKYLIFCLFLSSCANLGHYKTYQDSKGLYKYEFNGFKTSDTVRDNENKLILNEDKANKHLSVFKSVDELRGSFLVACEADYGLRETYHKADSLLKSSRPIEARKLLDDLASKCKNIKFHSHIDYLYAYSYELEGNVKLRDQYLNDFLSYSQSIYPHQFDQANSKNEDSELYKKYKMDAKNILAGEKFLFEQEKAEHLSFARYTSLDDSYLVGTKITKTNFYILPSYSSVTKGGLEGAYVFPTKYGALIPGVFFNEPFGTLARINLRTQVSQTLDRKHQAGVNIGAYQWKKITYNQNYFGSITDVEVKEEGVGTRIGYGGTYQFTTKYNLMYQAVGYSDYRVGSNATVLAGYNINETSMFQFGLLHNHTVIAWKVKQLYVMYDFSSQGINASMGAGFSF